jgi:hypothetical protein
MRKLHGRTRAGLVGALLAGLVVALGASGVAHAADEPDMGVPPTKPTIQPMADSHTVTGIAVRLQPNGDKVATLTDPFPVGDCTLDRGTSVTIKAPNAAGDTSITVRGQVKSSHPQVAWYDQWHSRFTFRSARGSEVLKSGTLNGPEMRTANRWYPVNAWQSVRIAPDFYDLVVQTDWFGEC